MKSVTVNQLKSSCGFDHVSKLRKAPYNGCFIIRRGYYYKMDMNARLWSENVRERLVEAGYTPTIHDCGDHSVPFRGGDPIEKSSHFWVICSV